MTFSATEEFSAKVVGLTFESNNELPAAIAKFEAVMELTTELREIIQKRRVRASKRF